MRQVGKLRRYEGDADNPQYFKGEMQASFYSGDVFIVPVDDKRSEGSPDWMVKVPDPAGGWQEFGAAWTKKTKVGEEFLSITFDDPMMPHPVYVSAFPLDQQPEDGSEHYRVVWTRARRQPQGRGDLSRTLGNDEVPY